MRLLGDRAAEYGIKLVMENHFNTMTVSAADSISLAQEINHPAVGILYDQANLTLQTTNRGIKPCPYSSPKYTILM